MRFQSIGVTKEWRRLRIITLAAAISSFQSIGVTKEWRLKAVFQEKPTPPPFPINRRHQRMATISCWGDIVERNPSFQSIGVTKEWRPHRPPATGSGRPGFPINRPHQRMATLRLPRSQKSGCGPSFQSIGLTKEWRPRTGWKPTMWHPLPGSEIAQIAEEWMRAKFPINRPHQRMATAGTVRRDRTALG